MKNLAILSFSLFTGLSIITTSCEKENDGPEAPELDIEVTPLVVDAKPGETVEYTVIVAGDLASVSVDGTEIKNYPEQTFNDTIVYTYTYPESATGDAEVTFVVTDNSGATGDYPVMVGFIQPDYSLANYSVKVADTATYSDWWEGVDLKSYPGATYDGGEASDFMYVTCRGSFTGPWDFQAVLPESMGTGLMMTREAIKNEDGSAAWGGYMIPVFGYNGPGMTTPDESQLNQVDAGTRVIAVDVYYETDPNSPASFDDISISNDGNGVKFQFRMGNHQKFVESADKGGWFLIKEAHLTETDKWVTLYFDADDEGEINATDDEGNIKLTMDGTSDNADFMWLTPAYDYPEYDSHKIYMKDLRITNLPSEE